MNDPTYTVKDNRIYKDGSTQPEPETKILLVYSDGREAELNLIDLPERIDRDGKVFTRGLKKDPVVYYETVVNLTTIAVAKIDADVIKNRLK